MMYLIYKVKRIIKNVMFYSVLFAFMYMAVFNKDFLLTETDITLSMAELMAVALMMVR